MKYSMTVFFSFPSHIIMSLSFDLMHIFDIEFLNKKHTKKYPEKNLPILGPPEYDTEALKMYIFLVCNYTKPKF